MAVLCVCRRSAHDPRQHAEHPGRSGAIESLERTTDRLTAATTCMVRPKSLPTQQRCFVVRRFGRPSDPFEELRLLDKLLWTRHATTAPYSSFSPLHDTGPLAGVELVSRTISATLIRCCGGPIQRSVTTTWSEPSWASLARSRLVNFRSVGCTAHRSQAPLLPVIISGEWP